MEQWPCICRLPDGAIDYDFYRRRARAERVVAIRDLFTAKRRNRPWATPTFLARLRAVWKS